MAGDAPLISTEAATITAEDLHAFADGQLPPDRAAAVAAHLALNEAAAAKVAEIRATNALLRRIEPPADPAPEAMLDLARALAQALERR